MVIWNTLILVFVKRHVAVVEMILSRLFSKVILLGFERRRPFTQSRLLMMVRLATHLAVPRLVPTLVKDADDAGLVSWSEADLTDQTLFQCRSLADVRQLFPLPAEEGAAVRMFL